MRKRDGGSSDVAGPAFGLRHWPSTSNADGCACRIAPAARSSRMELLNAQVQQTGAWPHSRRSGSSSQPKSSRRCGDTQKATRPELLLARSLSRFQDLRVSGCLATVPDSRVATESACARQRCVLRVQAVDGLALVDRRAGRNSRPDDQARVSALSMPFERRPAARRLPSANEAGQPGDRRAAGRRGADRASPGPLEQWSLQTLWRCIAIGAGRLAARGGSAEITERGYRWAQFRIGNSRSLRPS